MGDAEKSRSLVRHRRRADGRSTREVDNMTHDALTEHLSSEVWSAGGRDIGLKGCGDHAVRDMVAEVGEAKEDVVTVES